MVRSACACVDAPHLVRPGRRPSLHRRGRAPAEARLPPRRHGLRQARREAVDDHRRDGLVLLLRGAPVQDGAARRVPPLREPPAAGRGGDEAPARAAEDLPAVGHGRLGLPVAGRAADGVELAPEAQAAAQAVLEAHPVRRAVRHPRRVWRRPRRPAGVRREDAKRAAGGHRRGHRPDRHDRKLRRRRPQPLAQERLRLIRRRRQRDAELVRAAGCARRA